MPLSLVFIVADLGDVKWYLTVSNFIFQMTNDAEYLFMCLLAICIPLEKCLFKGVTYYNFLASTYFSSSAPCPKTLSHVGDAPEGGGKGGTESTGRGRWPLSSLRRGFSSGPSPPGASLLVTQGRTCVMASQ